MNILFIPFRKRAQVRQWGTADVRSTAGFAGKKHLPF